MRLMSEGTLPRPWRQARIRSSSLDDGLLCSLRWVRVDAARAGL